MLELRKEVLEQIEKLGCKYISPDNSGLYIIVDNCGSIKDDKDIHELIRVNNGIFGIWDEQKGEYIISLKKYEAAEAVYYYNGITAIRMVEKPEDIGRSEELNYNKYDALHAVTVENRSITNMTYQVRKDGKTLADYKNNNRIDYKILESGDKVGILCTEFDMENRVLTARVICDNEIYSEQHFNIDSIDYKSFVDNIADEWEDVIIHSCDFETKEDICVVEPKEYNKTDVLVAYTPGIWFETPMGFRGNHSELLISEVFAIKPDFEIEVLDVLDRTSFDEVIGGPYEFIF